MTDRAARANRASRDRLPWRTLFPAVLAPNLFYAAGQGAVIPVIPVRALDLGATYATAALAAAMLTVGQLVGTLPAGWLVGRIGERRSMLVAALINVVGGGTCLLASDLVLLTAGVAFIGIAAAVFTMARHAWVTVAVPVSIRGRALSLVAGFNRLGSFVGPFVSAGVIVLTHSTRSPFSVVVLTSLAVALVTVLVDVPEDDVEHAGAAEDVERPTVLRTFLERRDVLLRLGFCASVISMLRTSRQVIVPLWAVALGIPSAHIAVIVGVGAGIDFALFYLGGQIMDRYGRIWVAMPTLVSFGVAHVLLALTTSVDAGVVLFVGLVCLMATGNGLSSGVVAAMGSDLADRRNPAAFLSSWRLVTEIGPAAAPLLISAVAAVSTLAAASVALGLLSGIGGILLMRWVPQYLPKDHVRT
jgi:MFS family permease